MATIDIFATPADLVAMPKQTNPADVFGKVVQGGVDYYGALNTINAAKYNTKLLKAQAKAAVSEAKAGGVYAARAAGTGLPSPSLLLVGGLALAALFVLKR